MQKIESFELDHNAVQAPFVRKAGIIKSGATVINKYDIRFTQPNKEYISIEALHTLEHLLATNLRKYTEDLVDISPMGCRTGFYCIFVGDKMPEEVAELFIKGLRDVQKAYSIPGASEIECGNYRSHDLDGAKNYASKFSNNTVSELVKVFK